jgi:transposase
MNISLAIRILKLLKQAGGSKKVAQIAKKLGKSKSSIIKSAMNKKRSYYKNRLTPGQKRTMSESAARDKARLKRYRKGELEELEEVGFGRIAGQGREL